MTEKKKLEDQIRNDTIVLGRLVEILEEMESEVVRSQLTEDQFDNPNWSHLIAYQSGKLASFKQIKKLFTFIKE